MAGISEKERFERLELIKEKLEEGLNQSEIAEELGIPPATISRNVRYLKNLTNADLKPADIADKRADIWLKLEKIITDTKEDYATFRGAKKPKLARECLITQISAIKLQAMIYGLIQKSDGVQVNQQFNNKPLDRIDPDVGKRIAKELIKRHESRVRKENEVQ